MKPVPAERIKALSALLELDSDFLESCLRWEDQSWEDLSTGSAEVPPGLAARLRRIHRLCRDLDLDAFSGGIIVDLVERMEALQRELERLRAGRP